MTIMFKTSNNPEIGQIRMKGNQTNNGVWA